MLMMLVLSAAQRPADAHDLGFPAAKRPADAHDAGFPAVICNAHGLFNQDRIFNILCVLQDCEPDGLVMEPLYREHSWLRKIAHPRSPPLPGNQ